ncbi:MAG TPA: valine--tRNA ligase [Mycobacteriales bacterium]|nr:valine--tRNA ligase [Mycobacteriales bacterium]
MPAIPDPLPALQSLSEKWAPRWEADKTYAFDRDARRTDVFSIDSPPLTASGTLHVGHIFSYTHTDLIARFQRMRGKSVFYPVAFDDNGLPTERRVQNFYGVRCDPSLPDAPYRKGDRVVGRRTFLDLCARLTADDEAVYERTWRSLGLSVDWSLRYRTIGNSATEISQRAFLRNLARGEAYRAEAPTLWDATFQTAVAQAELVERTVAGAFHTLRFAGPAGDILIDTTRPELLPACVALVAHPSDPRYQAFFGSMARTPIFNVAVPVLAHELADPEKGTGIAMVCTFGDLTDVIWWRDLALGTRAVLDFNGRFRTEPPSDVDPGTYAFLAGLTPGQARTATVSRLSSAGSLVGEPRSITHAVRFYERGDRPLEIVPSWQWYIRNGGRDPELRAALLRRGAELNWHPPRMRDRLDSWVNGLRGDWLISRQRFLGVPIPVWYSLDQRGERSEVLVPADAALPIDPASTCPPGYRPEQRDQPGGFTADPDVLDTWATSSLSPLIAAGEMRDQVYPMDLHPHAHEIIRTWLFNGLLRAHLDFAALPWSDVAISGWVVDSQHDKIGKSAGNAQSPDAMLDRFGPDALRYWAARGRPGTDTAFDQGQLKVGRRLATKLLNASRFVLSFGVEPAAPAERPLDRAMLAALSDVAARATSAFEAYDYTRALEQIEEFFWLFCDDYIELVKERAYGGCASARTALCTALSVLQRLLAPFLPFATEEVWSWWQPGSIHRASWPVEVFAGYASSGEATLLSAASELLAGIRRAKSSAALGMRQPVAELRICGPADLASSGAMVVEELLNAAHADRIEFVDAPELTVTLV